MIDRKKFLLWLLLIAGAGVFLFLSFWQYLRPPAALELRDPLLSNALMKVKEMPSYAQEVRTEAIFPGRRLKIEGVYLVDRGQNRYSSVATTTVFTPKGGKESSFTLSNISIDNEVYTRIASDDPTIQASFGDSSMWNHFSSTAIPSRFAGVAIPGPVLDNLRILEDNGGYLSLIASSTREKKTGFTRYLFELAPAHRGAPAGTLQALMGHIADGTIEMWVDDDATVRMLAFSGPDYRSTTTVRSLGEDQHIGPPPASVVQ